MTQAMLMPHPLCYIMVSLSNKTGEKYIEKMWQEIIKQPTGLLGGPVVQNLLMQGDMRSIPGLGRSDMPQRN